jgi:hypothetical protein
MCFSDGLCQGRYGLVDGDGGGLEIPNIAKIHREMTGQSKDKATLA